MLLFLPLFLILFSVASFASSPSCDSSLESFWDVIVDETPNPESDIFYYVEEAGAVYFYDRTVRGHLPMFAIAKGNVEHPQVYFGPERKHPVFGILGVIEHKNEVSKQVERFVMLLTERRFQTCLYRRQHPIYTISKVRLCRIDGSLKGRDAFMDTVESYYSTCKMAYSPTTNLSSRRHLAQLRKEGAVFDDQDFQESHAFSINKNILEFFLPYAADTLLMRKLVVAVLGYVETTKLVLPASRDVIYLAFLSCLSPDRIGTRYGTRGVDSNGNIANHVETTVLVAFENEKDKSMRIATFLQVRGSVPLLWKQEPTLKQVTPPIEITDDDVTIQSESFKKHMGSLKKRHGGPTMILNLLSTIGGTDEDFLGRAFQNLCTDTTMIRYDLNAAKSLERLLPFMRRALLRKGFDLTIIEEGISRMLLKQCGVLRTNCLDCLDRTNRAQTAFSLLLLPQMIFLLNIPAEHHAAITEWINKQWILNGDALSMLSCGSKALTGGASFGHKATDIKRSMHRYFNDHVTVASRETALECIRFVDRDHGNVVMSTAFRFMTICDDYYHGADTLQRTTMTTLRDPSRIHSKVLSILLRTNEVLMFFVDKLGLFYLMISALPPDHPRSIIVPLYAPLPTL